MQLEVMAAIFTGVCAFRSIMPRIDVSRVCWFDTPLNWPIVGRSAACIAELAWAAQMACIVRRVAIRLRARGVLTQQNLYWFCNAANAVFCLAFIAEGCSWTNLITENNLFAVVEQALWSLLFFITGMALLLLKRSWHECPRSYMLFITITMLMATEQFVEAFALYLPRYLADERSQHNQDYNHTHTVHHYQSFSSGLHRLSGCAVVSHDIAVWASDAPWMLLYFSVAVWTSIWLSSAPVPTPPDLDAGHDAGSIAGPSPGGMKERLLPNMPRGQFSSPP